MENTADIQVNEPETNKKKSLLANSLQYGLYTATAYVLFSLLLYVIDVKQTGWINYLSFLILIAGIVVGTIAFRDKFSGGFLSYGRCLASGVLISIVVGLVMALYSYLFFSYFDPGALAGMMEASEQEMMNRGITDEQIDQALAFSGKLMSPAFLGISSFLSMALIGTIISLITSAFLKKEDNSFDGAFRES